MRAYYEQEHTLNVKTVKGGPQRLFIPLTSGFLRGKGVEASLVPGAADLPLVRTFHSLYWSRA